MIYESFLFVSYSKVYETALKTKSFKIRLGGYLKTTEEKRRNPNAGQFQYQIPLAAKITSSLENQPKPVVLACTTSGGKSYIVTLVLEHFFKNGRERNAVFLGSNQTILAKQFHDVLTNCPVPFNFSYSMLKDSQDSQLKIGLPQQLINKPHKLDLLILDESQLLWKQIEKNPKSMMSKILHLCEPERILLLTGSPSYFTKGKDQYAIHYLSYEDIANDKNRVFSKVDLDLVVVDKESIEESLKIFWRSAKHNRNDLSQLAIVAKDIKQAENIKKVLEEKYRLKTMISTSNHDLDSANLDIFKNGEFDCCITVNRIFTGWSYNNLTSVLDFAASQNLDRSFQLFSRLLRVKNDFTVKTYHRICLRRNIGREILFLHKMKALLKRDNYMNFTGNNLLVVSA